MSSIAIMSRLPLSWRQALSETLRIEMSFLNESNEKQGLKSKSSQASEEARRTLLGIRSGLPAGVTDILALDIGGGSTEFILDRRGQEPITRSIDIGVVRLCERVLHHDPPTAEEVRQAREWVIRETKTAVADDGWLSTGDICWHGWHSDQPCGHGSEASDL